MRRKRRESGKKPIIVCVYDNFDTMSRECWQNGRLLYSYSAVALESKPASWETQSIPSEYLFFGANVGSWVPGRLIGERSAMEPEDSE